ncbi:hypothetical protein [Streptomyces goshikiensis]|uniref:hypothetical protein n=1 Tax=Streptomyces goshikiensis TaxID=1942 RepID=UPI00380DC6B7
MDEALDLLDGVSAPRLKLISADEGRPLMGLLDDAALPEDIHRAGGEMRFRLGSRAT